MAHYAVAGPLKDPEYKDLASVSRSLHFDDYKLCYDSKRMPSRGIKVKGTRSYMSHAGEVLWFGPSLDSKSEHNWYGNVTFTIDLDALVSKYGNNFYYIDKQEFETHTSSRILLASSNNALTKIDVSASGAPLHQSCFRYQHVAKCWSDRFSKTVPHHLEIAIRTEGAMNESWFYKKAAIEPNDHSQANTQLGFGSHTCHRYNNFDKTCPYKLTLNEALAKLQKEYPSYNQNSGC